MSTAHDADGSAKFRSDVVWNFASLVVLGVSGVALNVLIGLHWDEATLGVFNQTLAAYTLFSQAAVGGINLSALRAIAEKPGDRGRLSVVAWSSLAPTVVLAAVVTLVYWLARHPLAAMLDSPAVAEAIAWSAPGLFFFAINKVLMSIVNGARRMRAFAIFTSIRYLGILVALLVAMKLAMPSAQLAYVFSASEAFLFGVLAFEVGRLIDWRIASGFGGWVREHIVYGAKSVFSGVLLELNAKVDIWMIGMFMSDKSVGIYTFAAMIAEGVYQLLVVLQNNYNPVLARLLAVRDFTTLRATVCKGRKWTYIGMASVAVVAVALYPTAVSILTDKPDFAASWAPFGWLMAGIVVASGYIPFGQMLLMANQPTWHTLLMTSTVIVNVIGNFILIPRIGIEGAAIATAISMATSVFMLKWFVKRRVGASI
ncbi:MAG: oligosaccharide flippase family protein [Planctomycetota bacterium]|nr:oligosaccharide flippase family protein [Planctomycetota bacterium]